MSVRRIAPDDVPTVTALVHELARYEKAADQCRLRPDQLATALFGEHPHLFGHVAEQDGEVVGCALWFLNYSTWDGVHGIYLEDLVVRADRRGGGHGKALLVELAAECERQGYSRLQWWVLDWNSPTIDFYRSLGAEAMDEWVVHRVSGTPLTALAALARAGS
ncbi:GNAT family N-acetyltransferase [Actinomycetospora flava]|uniref:GNAT family N-acetyltransferase n=1 Tax=Actinomycetospora flava TaxID=3129232 RepID=A0ABU8MGJ8_9PSEU